MPANRSLIDHTGIPGELLLRSGGSVDVLRSLTPLPEDSQRLYDQRVIEVGMERLSVVAAMLADGLVFNLPNPLGVMEVWHDRVNRVGYAQRSMLPDTRGENQLMDRNAAATPIYITHDDFNLNVRLKMAADRAGVPLDTAQAGQCVRNVNEAIEDAAINGWTDAAGVLIANNGRTAPGLLNAPNATSTVYTGGEAWDATGHTGEEIIADILAMVDAQVANQMWGPYRLFIPTLYDNKLNYDYKSATSGTIRQRISELNVGGRPLSITVADKLPANRTALVQMTPDVCDVIVGQEPTVLSWASLDGFNRFYKVMAIMIPRFKDTYDAQSGVVLGYTS